MPQEEWAQIDAVQRRLARTFSEIPYDDVVGVVQREYSRFKQSKLRSFIPLFVERRAVEYLAKSTIHRGPDSEADSAVVNGQILDTLRDVNSARPRALTRWRLSFGSRRLELLRTARPSGSGSESSYQQMNGVPPQGLRQRRP